MKTKKQSGKNITVLIADDHPIVRQGLRQILSLEKDITVIGDVGDGETALHILKQHPVRVALFDIDMPRMNGLEAAKNIQNEELQTNIVIMTMYKEESIFEKAMEYGAKGYLIKENAIAEIVNAVRSVASGNFYISPSLSNFLVKNKETNNASTQHIALLQNLTPTERKVLHLIGENKSSKEIADLLFISYRTVENHRTNICSKLNIKGSHALLRFVIEHKGMA